jgi:hypothetical protein
MCILAGNTSPFFFWFVSRDVFGVHPKKVISSNRWGFGVTHLGTKVAYKIEHVGRYDFPTN